MASKSELCVLIYLGVLLRYLLFSRLSLAMRARNFVRGELSCGLGLFDPSLSARIAVFLRAVAVRGPCDKERRSPHKSPSVKVKLEISSWTYGGRTLKNGARLYFVHGAARLRQAKKLQSAQTLSEGFFLGGEGTILPPVSGLGPVRVERGIYGEERTALSVLGISVHFIQADAPIIVSQHCTLFQFKAILHGLIGHFCDHLPPFILCAGTHM